MKTLILDAMPDEFWQIIKDDFSEYFTTDKNDPDNIEIIILRTRTILTGKDLSQFPKLKMIIRAGSGFDNIDIKAALKKGIVVCTTPKANVQAAFEHTISLIMAMLKQHQIGKRNIIKGDWKRNLTTNWELSELKSLVVGVGRIGTKVGRFLLSLGAQVKGVDPYLTEKEWKTKGLERSSYKEGLAWSNLITFHCPLYQETKDYFNSEALNLLSSRIWLVNTARGGIINESTLKTGLNSGKILGFAGDVYSQEPPTVEEFFKRDNIYLTPHIGAYTFKAKRRLVSETLKVWKSFVFEKNIINQIDQRFI